jgi:hypothetical protein
MNKKDTSWKLLIRLGQKERDSLKWLSLTKKRSLQDMIATLILDFIDSSKETIP